MLTIRPLLETDNEQYRELWLYGVTALPEFFRIAAEDDPAPDIPTDFKSDSFTLGAWMDAELVGVVSLRRDVLNKLKHKALVCRMFVHPRASGHGLGRALLKQLIADVRSATDIRQIYLTVLASNERAINLYRSLGFKEYAREPQAVKIGDGYVDELLMMCFMK
jgi:cyclohexyl-isocyanide hydratase